VGSVVAAGSRLFFTVTTPELGTELWVSDGTQAGTVPIDIVPGPEGSDPSELTAVGEDLIFAADDGARGREPWVSDGTAAGTRRLADLLPGVDSSDPRDFTWVGPRVYFHTLDLSPPGRRLWSVPSGVSGTFPAGVPEDATAILAPEYPDFRFWVRISAGDQVLPARREPLCIPETVCVSGALPGRSELFLRIVGPRDNGFWWPILVRFTTSRVDVWIEQTSTGVLQHYVLDAATPGSSDLDGLFDRRGFPAD
jgi:ELWxxDGT repeat protein